MDTMHKKPSTFSETTYSDFSNTIHFKAGFQKPLSAELELTYGCNLKCVHCYTDCYNAPQYLQKELPFDKITRILDEMAESGVLWLCLTGGEIFMRKDFRKIYLYAKEKGFLVTLFTNATLIREADADFLKTYPPFSIETSLHGGTEKTFDEITQVQGSFKRFLEGVRSILERNLPLKIKTKAMKNNLHELEEIKALVESFGLEFRVSTPLYPRLNGNLDPIQYRLDPEETIEVETRYGQHQDKEDACGVEEDSEKVPQNLYRCGCGTTSFKVDPYGVLRSCTFVTQPTRPLLQTKHLRDHFYDLAQEIRSKTYQTDSPCHTCTAYRYCDKIPESALQEVGGVEKPVEHFCHVAFRREAIAQQKKKEVTV